MSKKDEELNPQAAAAAKRIQALEHDAQHCAERYGGFSKLTGMLTLALLEVARAIREKP